MRTNRLRVVRAERDVTQMQLSRKTGINPSKLSQIENGWVIPSTTEQQVIATALQATVNEVFPEQVSA